MDKALWNTGRKGTDMRASSGRRLDWRKKMSDNVAYGLLVYTGLQIFVTMGALEHVRGSILPYFALVVLVAAIIPGCRVFERRWEMLSDDEAADPAFARAFRRDQILIWAGAILLPLAITGLFVASNHVL